MGGRAGGRGLLAGADPRLLGEVHAHATMRIRLLGLFPLGMSTKAAGAKTKHALSRVTVWLAFISGPAALTTT